jgi:hypothetical protein
MPDLFMPRILIVTQTVFGSPLANKEEFSFDDVDQLVKFDIGRYNAATGLNRLVELGWLKKIATPVEKRTSTEGRPNECMYQRTDRGRREYAKIVAIYANHGIQLKQ